MTFTSLRAVTHRLTTTPVHELPQITSFLAASLSDCSELLSTTHGQGIGKDDSEVAAQLHKLRVRIASLLQDRTMEGRWTGLVLTKAVLEAGQWESLRGYEPVVRSLLSILTKPDPVSTKKMCIIALTRIFHLTYEYPTLLREITTPSLPAFINSTLNLVSTKRSPGPTRRLKPNTPLLEPVLRAFSELIARHPTIFRPFSAQIHSLLVAILGPSPDVFFSRTEKDLAGRLFILLHNCAPKGTSEEEWRNAVKLTTLSIHRVSDKVYRAVIEQWEPSDPNLSQAAKTSDYNQEVRGGEADPLGLSSWHGIFSGAERLITLLRLLAGFLSAPTASNVTIPVGHILDLTSRLTTVTVPQHGIDLPHSDVQVNPQIGQTERDCLWAELPRIHVACMRLLSSLVNVLETSAVSVAQTIMEQILWVFRAESFNDEIRASTYDLIRSIVSIIGPSMTKENMSHLLKLLHFCCRDLLTQAADSRPLVAARATSMAKTTACSTSINADTFLNPALNQDHLGTSPSSSGGLFRASSELLSTILAATPADLFSPSLRVEIDRTIILAAEKNAMLASVLNPMPAATGRGVAPSIIPFLARRYAGEMEVEGFVRPRMPVLSNNLNLNSFADIGENDSEDTENGPGSVCSGSSRNIGLLNSPLPAIPDIRTADLEPDKRLGITLNKRSSAESVDDHASGQLPQVTEGVQKKKPRFIEDSLTVSHPPTERGALVSALPTTSASVTREAPALGVSIRTEPADLTAGRIHAAGLDVAASLVDASNERPSRSHHEEPSGETMDESDVELPTLNAEPDTDEDEDDEGDTAMGN